MPLSFQRDDPRQRVVVIGSGHVTTDEFAGCVARQISEGLWQYGMIYDFKIAESIPSPEEFRRSLKDMRELSAEAGVRGPVAIVVTDPTLQERTREYIETAKALPYRIQIFTRLREAEEWLETEIRSPRRSSS